MLFQDAISQELKGISQKKLISVAKELSRSYRKENGFFFSSPLHRLAYLTTRFPATLAVAQSVLNKLPKQVESVLELGAGVGTSLWALPFLSNITLVEKDLGLIEMGQRLKPGPYQWIHSDCTQIREFPKSDLILFSYSIGELEGEKAYSLLKTLFQQTLQFLVIIEPGTPKGFERIRNYRELFIKLNGHIIAPCPHTKMCPMEGKNWCHFSERLSRDRLHRILKEGELGYEDEKYSYLIISKDPFPKSGKRILRHPQKRSGHITFELCREIGVEKKTLSKKEGDAFKDAKRLKWGDVLDHRF